MIFQAGYGFPVEIAVVLQIHVGGFKGFRHSPADPPLAAEVQRKSAVLIMLTAFFITIMSGGGRSAVSFTGMVPKLQILEVPVMFVGL
jgi:hypothetical protein